MLVIFLRNRCQLNICLAYTSRLEMAQAVRDTAWGVEEGLILPEDVNSNLLDSTLEVSTVDLLVRTSGEVGDFIAISKFDD